MDKNEDLISIWQSNITTLKDDLILSSTYKTENVMDTIIQFEQQEKKEKKNQIFSAFVLATLTIIFLYNVELTTIHFIGLIMLIIGTAFGIISNRTDDFPDFRQLNTSEYLVAFKNNTTKRSQRHIIHSILGAFIGVPGLYLTFQDSFPQLGNFWFPIMMVSGIVTTIFWFRNYNQRSGKVLEQIDTLLEDFELKED